MKITNKPSESGPTKDQIRTAIFNALEGTGWTYDQKADRVKEVMRIHFNCEDSESQ